MRYYVLAIQHNKEKDAENRTAPKAYDKRDDAVAEYHRQLSVDMKNDTLDSTLVMLINSTGAVERVETWTEEPQQTAPAQ